MSRVSFRRFAGVALATGVVGIGVAGAPAASAQTTTPATLSGEMLSGASGEFDGVGCLTGGPFSFSTSGTATGPYPGTFTETGSGTVTYAADGTGTGPVSFSASFKIDSANGEVTGTKTFNGPVAPFGVCYQDPNNYLFTAVPSYQATIQTSQSNYTDQGTADTYVAESSGTLNTLSETFASSRSQPTLLEPTSTAQCMNGGYQNFPQFRNQGQCVAYTEHS